MVLLSTVCRVVLMPVRTTTMINSSTFARNPNVTGFLKVQMNPVTNPVRNFKLSTQLRGSNKDNHFIRQLLKAMKNIGHGAVMGVCIVGLGALACYGLRLSNEPSTCDQSVMWPSYVRERIRTTYAYFGGSCIIIALSVAAVSQSPALMGLLWRSSSFRRTVLVITNYESGSKSQLFSKLTLRSGLPSEFIVSDVGWTTMIAASMGMSIPYQPGFGTKQLACVGSAAFMGILAAYLCLLGGPIFMRAAMMTAGAVTGLSAVAVCSPSEEFLNMAGPLGICFGVAITDAGASVIAPTTTALGSRLVTISLYCGGLIVFSGILLRETQKVIKYAESVPPNSIPPYDPVHATLSIYMDTIRHFIRIARKYINK